MKIAKKGADSHSRFKSDVANPDSLAAEIVSLLNADGGTIYLGISDNGDISGLDGEDVRRLNLMISNVATQHIKNPVTVLTDNILLSNSKVVIAIKVPEGREKPYFDKNGIARWNTVSVKEWRPLTAAKCWLADGQKEENA